MENTRVTTKSGLDGWQGRLQDQYDDFDSFCHYDEMYGLAAKLGFWGPGAAWQCNPLVQGSTNPGDFCRVLEPREMPVTVKVIVELQVDVDDPSASVAKWKIGEAAEQTVANAVEFAVNGGCSNDHADILSVGFVSAEVGKELEKA